MIRKLRRKFVLINMSFVFVVLLIVFGALFFSTAQRLESESYDAMRRAVSKDGEMTPPKFEIGGGQQRPHGDKGPSTLPVFWVQLDESGQIEKTVSENVTVSDEVVASAVSQILEGGDTEGVLSSLDLRYLLQQTPVGTKIAFADISGERDSLMSLLFSSLLIGGGGLLAFLVISIFLSRWVLRPLEKSWEQQRQFVADASHELKTPLTVILANTGILLANPQETIGAQQKWVTYTQTEAQRMKKLVDDLLFLTRSDDGQLPTLEGQVNVSDAIWSCLLPFESVAFEQGITLNSDIAPDCTVIGDEGQLKQLAVILLDNACKYAGDKKVVTCCLTRTPDKLKWTVNNTGEPIPAEDLSHLFERFYRADKSRYREEGGYGLGLAIAKSIVDRHGGKITVESNAQLGTTFTIWLPMK